MSASLYGELSVSRQDQEQFAYQGSRLQSVIAPFPPHMHRGNAFELRINGLDVTEECLLISAFPLRRQIRQQWGRRDFRLTGRCLAFFHKSPDELVNHIVRLEVCQWKPPWFASGSGGPYSLSVTRFAGRTK